jgi:hypothetical protein
VDDPQSAESAFRKAISFGASADSDCGFAQVLAKLNPEEAFRLLEKGPNQDQAGEDNQGRDCIGDVGQTKRRPAWACSGRAISSLLLSLMQDLPLAAPRARRR